MKLFECRIGEIVCSISAEGNIDKVGHITGLSANNYDEVIPMVQWSREKKPVGVHYRNIDLLEKGEKKSEKIRKLKQGIE